MLAVCEAKAVNVDEIDQIIVALAMDAEKVGSLEQLTSVLHDVTAVLGYGGTDFLERCSQRSRRAASKSRIKNGDLANGVAWPSPTHWRRRKRSTSCHRRVFISIGRSRAHSIRRGRAISYVMASCT